MKRYHIAALTLLNGAAMNAAPLRGAQRITQCGSWERHGRGSFDLKLLRRDEYLNRAARAQAGALLTNHIAPGRRTLAPSRCAASASRMDATAAVTTSAS